jgi:hypothetical protein
MSAGERSGDHTNGLTAEPDADGSLPLRPVESMEKPRHASSKLRLYLETADIYGNIEKPRSACGGVLGLLLPVFIGLYFVSVLICPHHRPDVLTLACVHSERHIPKLQRTAADA